MYGYGSQVRRFMIAWALIILTFCMVLYVMFAEG